MFFNLALRIVHVCWKHHVRTGNFSFVKYIIKKNLIFKKYSIIVVNMLNNNIELFMNLLSQFLAEFF